MNGEGGNRRRCDLGIRPASFGKGRCWRRVSAGSRRRCHRFGQFGPFTTNNVDRPMPAHNTSGFHGAERLAFALPVPPCFCVDDAFYRVPFGTATHLTTSLHPSRDRRRQSRRYIPNRCGTRAESKPRDRERVRARTNGLGRGGADLHQRAFPTSGGFRWDFAGTSLGLHRSFVSKTQR